MIAERLGDAEPLLRLVDWQRVVGVPVVRDHRLEFVPRPRLAEHEHGVVEHLLDPREDDPLVEEHAPVDPRPPEVDDQPRLDAAVLARLNDAGELRDRDLAVQLDDVRPAADVDRVACLDDAPDLRLRMDPRLLEGLVVTTRENLREHLVDRAEGLVVGVGLGEDA